MTGKLTLPVCGIVFLTVVLVDRISLAQQPTDAGGEPSESTPLPATVRRQAFEALARGDNVAAVNAAETLVRRWSDNSDLVRTAGDICLRAGQAEKATQLFDRYLAAKPDDLPYLWQRGISLYFTGQYDKAAKQFELHRTVNPNDVENAAWHFLCVAKARSVQQAQRLVLPAPGDPRVPMQEVLEMLSNGDRDAVKKRVEAVSAAGGDRETAAFYGDFYLGLYADALGDSVNAARYLKKAAKDAPHHYMGDVARVYARFLDPQ